MHQNPSRCCHIDKTNSFVAVGCNAGSITIFYLTDQLNKKGNYFKVEEVAFRKDAKSEATDIKFSPSNEMVLYFVLFLSVVSAPRGEGRHGSPRRLHLRLRGEL